MEKPKVKLHWSLRGIRLRSTKVSIFSSRRRPSSIISSSEKVGLSIQMEGCEVWRIDG